LANRKQGTTISRSYLLHSSSASAHLSFAVPFASLCKVADYEKNAKPKPFLAEQTQHIFDFSSSNFNVQGQVQSKGFLPSKAYPAQWAALSP
jgi:hypothetical protein